MRAPVALRLDALDRRIRYRYPTRRKIERQLVGSLEIGLIENGKGGAGAVVGAGPALRRVVAADRRFGLGRGDVRGTGGVQLPGDGAR